MKRIYQYIAIILGFLSIGLIGYFFTQQKQESKKIEKKNVEIHVEGAVEYPNIYIVNKGTALRQVLFLAKLKKDADLTKINLNSALLENKRIYIPYLINSENKLNIDNYTDINQLTKHKIAKRIAKAILELKNKNSKITWKDIDNIYGVGQKYLEKLKSILILNN